MKSRYTFGICILHNFASHIVSSMKLMLAAFQGDQDGKLFSQAKDVQPLK